MNDASKQAEMSKELRSARNYLFAVGILMVVMDLVFMFVLTKGELDPRIRNIALGIDAVVLVVFITLGAFVHKKPRFCMITGLILFWAIQLASAYDNPKALSQGIIIKILFTMALWKGLQSASKAQVLKRDLEKVFE